MPILFNIIYLWRKNKERPNRLKSFLFAKLNCCSTLKFTVFNRQPEGSFMCSQELVMNHNKRECKGTVCTGCRHSVYSTFVFSVLLLVLHTLKLLQNSNWKICSYNYVAFRIGRSNVIQRHARRDKFKTSGSAEDILGFASTSKEYQRSLAINQTPVVKCQIRINKFVTAVFFVKVYKNTRVGILILATLL